MTSSPEMPVEIRAKRRGVAASVIVLSSLRDRARSPPWQLHEKGRAVAGPAHRTAVRRGDLTAEIEAEPEAAHVSGGGRALEALKIRDSSSGYLPGPWSRTQSFAVAGSAVNQTSIGARARA
jgi:hypothetical protein